MDGAEFIKNSGLVCYQSDSEEDGERAGHVGNDTFSPAA